ncbi:MAG: dCTP deaminase [bacterium]|nr:dCTP deaminase [bacterium]
MILSKQTIQKLLKEKKIKINPFSEADLGAVSIDLHLGAEGLNPDSGKEVDLNDYHLSLDEFLLANTQEYVALPDNIVARVVPRSSLARLGVLATFDADILPPNYSGKPLLTLKNLSKKPILLKAGLAVAQIMFEQVDAPVEGYASRYNHEKPEESKLCEEMVEEKN